jgi:ABC-type taurine transport system ATPase subunit
MAVNAFRLSDVSERTLRLNSVGGRSLRFVSAEFGAGLHVILTRDRVGHDELFAYLSGTLSPQRGRITLNHREPAHDPELRSHIGSLWPIEEVHGKDAPESYLGRLGFSRTRVEAIKAQYASLLGLGSTNVADTWNDPVCYHKLALAIALTTIEPYTLILYEPLAALEPLSRSEVIEQLLRFAKNVPVLYFTASTSLAEQLGGATHDLQSGYCRLAPVNHSDWQLVRITGLGLRTLTGELSKRPSLRSLRFSTEPMGQEVLWLETHDSRQLLLDIVRIARELEIRLFAIQTTAVTP